MLFLILQYNDVLLSKIFTILICFTASHFNVFSPCHWPSANETIVTVVFYLKIVKQIISYYFKNLNLQYLYFKLMFEKSELIWNRHLNLFILSLKAILKLIILLLLFIIYNSELCISFKYHTCRFIPLAPY